MSLIEFQDYPSTETPLNAENLNHNFNELNNANTYSTEEQVIGTWINGKKIYRKVIELGELGDTSETNVFTLNGNYEYVLPSTMFYLNNPSNGSVITIPANLGTDVNITVSATSNKQGVIEINSTRGQKGVWVEWVLNCVLEYTKTNE
jgi:hypothetical protein